jgi:acetylornithine deacetylase/succinyl-diaminopimelate desuccinylase-like protein
MLPEDVRDYIDAHRDRFVESLCEFLRIPSVANAQVSPHPCRAAADWLADYCRSLGLATVVLPTDGQPVVIARHPAPADAPTVLVYGHYDVQPAEPLELWDTPPFEPTVREGQIFARGANDDKGQLFAHLIAFEAWQQAGGGVPVGVTFFFEGEEEIGSPTLEPFIEAHRELLAADACVISDSEFFAEGVPSITYSLRGLTTAELTVTGPARDVHSGVNGGGLANPINVLTALVGGMHDADGRVTLPGFYDDVIELTDAERAEWARLPFDDGHYARAMGVDALGGGEAGYTALERRWGRPTLDANGIVGGYVGPGDKTIIPSTASVKLSMRLVPDQDPRKVFDGLQQYVARNTPAGVRASVELHAGARAVMLPTDSSAMRAARVACAEAFGREPAMIRCGASVPVTEVFQRLLGLDAVMLGLGLPDDNIHSPNERFKLSQLLGGAAASAALLGELGRGA